MIRKTGSESCRRRQIVSRGAESEFLQCQSSILEFPAGMANVRLQSVMISSSSRLSHVRMESRERRVIQTSTTRGFNCVFLYPEFCYYFEIEFAIIIVSPKHHLIDTRPVSAYRHTRGNTPDLNAQEKLPNTALSSPFPIVLQFVCLRRYMFLFHAESFSFLHCPQHA